MIMSMAVQFLMIVPPLLLYLALIVMSTIYIRRLPLAATVALVGGAIMLLSMLYRFAVQNFYLPQARTNFAMIQALFLVQRIGSFLGQSLLAVAMYLGFSKATSQKYDPAAIPNI